MSPRKNRLPTAVSTAARDCRFERSKLPFYRSIGRANDPSTGASRPFGPARGTRTDPALVAVQCRLLRNRIRVLFRRSAYDPRAGIDHERRRPIAGSARRHRTGSADTRTTERPAFDSLPIMNDRDDANRAHRPDENDDRRTRGGDRGWLQGLFGGERGGRQGRERGGRGRGGPQESPGQGHGGRGDGEGRSDRPGWGRGSGEQGRDRGYGEQRQGRDPQGRGHREGQPHDRGAGGQPQRQGVEGFERSDRQATSQSNLEYGGSSRRRAATERQQQRQRDQQGRRGRGDQQRSH